MKISIKFKMITLGVALSVLVSAASLVFSGVLYRQRSRARQDSNIETWLETARNDFEGEENGEYYTSCAVATKKYLLEQYAEFPDEPEEGLSTTQEFYFYKDRFNWMYSINGIAMHYMTDEEREFRSKYEELMFLLSQGMVGSKAKSISLGFVDSDNTFFFMGDNISYRNIIKDGMNFPGERIHNYSGKFSLRGEFWDVKYPNAKTMTRAMPVLNEGITICYLFVDFDYSEVDAEANSIILTESIALSIALVLMIVAYSLGAHFLVIRNMKKLTKSTGEFSTALQKGKALKVSNPGIKSKDEIHELSDSFVTLESNIINYIDVIQKDTQAKERMNAELSVATNIQLGALPNNSFDNKDVSIRAFIKSAKEVGGDFYDYFYIDESRLAVIISDVSGKGIPAALFMMKSKELLKSAVRSHKSLTNAVKEVNAMLLNNNNEMLFVTSFIGIIDFKKETINYVNAGHEKPYIVSNNKVKKLEGESNFVMGGVEDFEYKEESVSFKKGDYLFMFTDGLNESINNNEEEFSYSRVESTLENNEASLPDEVIHAMNVELETFVGKKEQFDDVTMLVIKFKSDNLHLSYDKKDYSIISDIIDKFELYYKDLSSDIKSKAGIVIDELVNNLVSYEKREDLIIDVDFKVNKDDLEIIISCNGDDYDPFANHEEKYLEGFHPEIKEGGFGLSIIKDLAKSYSYEYKDHHSITKVIIGK